MAITTDCPSCGKKYKAADRMVGHRVRCRGCGTVFPLTTGGNGGDADLSALAELAGVSPAEALAAGTTAGEAGNDDPNIVFDQAFTGFVPTIRPNRPYYFPLAQPLDRYLPSVLLAASFAWVAVVAFTRNGAAPAWAPVLRIFLLTAGFLAAVVPLGCLAVARAARLARFELPPSPNFRTTAALSLPYGVICILWLTSEGFADMVPGVILGLAVAGGCVWLLVRIQPEEAAVTLGLTAAAFLLSLGAIVLGLTGANAVARLAAGESKASLAASPVGPGLAWDAPAKPAAPAKPPTDGPKPAAGDPANPDAASPDAVAAAAPNPADGPSTDSAPPGGVATPGGVAAPGTARPATDPTRPAVAVAPGGEAATPGATARPPAVPGGSAGADPLASSKLFGGGPSSARPPPPSATPPPPIDAPPPDPDPPLPGTVAPRWPTTPAGGAAGPGSAAVVAGGDDPVATEVRATRSLLVAAVRSGATVGAFDRIVPTLTPSPLALVVSKVDARPDYDQISVWNLDAGAQVGKPPEFKRDAGKGVSLTDGAPTYAVSPDGQTWARVTSFPALGLASTPLAGTGAPVQLTFREPFGDAAVLGFVAADKVLIRWRSDNTVRLEVWDLKAKTMALRLPPIPFHPASPGDGAVSADGKWYAAVVGAPGRTGGPRAQLAVYDLTRAGPPRTVILAVADPELALKPSGMSFSGDGKRIALLYEQNGNTVLMAYKLSNLAAAEQMPVAAGTVAVPASPEKAADRLASVADGRGWLVGGNAVVDAETGGLLGLLGVTRPCANSAVGSGVALVYDDGGRRKLAVVRFNGAMIGKAPAPAAPVTVPGPAPRSPTSRPAAATAPGPRAAAARPGT